jgi:hypothetical protein
MNQQPDKLFREKLEGFHKPAPTAAWNKIEAGLQKKNNKVIWFRVAATLLLIAVAAFLIWTTQSAPAVQVATETNSKKELEPTKENRDQSITPEQRVMQPEQQKEQIAKRTVDKVKKSKKINPSTPQPDQQPAINEDTPASELVAFVPETTSGIDSLPIDKTTPADPIVIVANTTDELKKDEESRVLVFSVEEVDSKYLDKEALAKATSAQKKSSTFRKLLNKAYDLKNNQDPFGELRQKKNEILALNFKSEKRSQNK